MAHSNVGHFCYILTIYIGMKHLITESILLDTIPDDIRQAVLQHRTSLGNNPAVPDIYDIPYILKVVNAEFDSAKEALKEIGSIDGVDESSLESALASLIHKCEEIERPYRSELEKICFNYIIDLFAVPEDAVDLSITLTDKVDTSRDSVILDPADGDEDMEFDDLGDAMAIKGEVYKRRFLDAVCMGIGLDFSYSIDESVLHQIDEINPELRKLYTEITALNNYLLFTKEDLGMTDDNNLQMGTFELRLGNEETKCSIESQGVIFPFLLCETIRGFMDLFISHGLPKEKNRAISVLGKSDFLKAEPWDMRLGRHMWNMVRKSLNDISFDYIPYLFKRLSSLETDKFNFLMKEVLAGTKKGRRIMAFICNKAKDDSEYDKFVDRMDKMKKDKGIITDDYIHPEEL